MMLGQMRPQLEAMFAPVSNGAALLQTLFSGVRSGLLQGLQVIFFSSAVIMCLAVVLHMGLKNVPLRGHQQPVEPPAH